jgi:hypothetical protein
MASLEEGEDEIIDSNQPPTILQYDQIEIASNAVDYVHEARNSI